MKNKEIRGVKERNGDGWNVLGGNERQDKDKTG